jgi:hypothetical protein
LNKLKRSFNQNISGIDALKLLSTLKVGKNKLDRSSMENFFQVSLLRPRGCQKTGAFCEVPLHGHCSIHIERANMHCQGHAHTKSF